jgi:Protein of unknown function (DUF3489)
MRHFTIENETNNIVIHGSAKEADALPNTERFSNEAALAKLAADWSAARLVEIWNSLPGETPMRKFKDRATAVSRIWKAIQNLGGTAPVAEETILVPEQAPIGELPETAQPEVVVPESTEPAVDAPVAPHAPDVAPEAPALAKKATRAKKAPVAASAKEAGAPGNGSKTSKVIAMLKREGGTTLEEIMTAMPWQKHTTRAMLSAGGSLTKKHGLVVTSEKVGDKRVYSIKARTNRSSFPPAAGFNPGGLFRSASMILNSSDQSTSARRVPAHPDVRREADARLPRSRAGNTPFIEALPRELFVSDREPAPTVAPGMPERGVEGNREAALPAISDLRGPRATHLPSPASERSFLYSRNFYGTAEQPRPH